MQGVPARIVNACRDGVMEAAEPFNPVRVDAVSAGAVKALGKGEQIAPLAVRIVYGARNGGYEVREAMVQCRFNARGTVVAIA